MSLVLDLAKTEFVGNEVLYGISWEEYERISANYEDKNAPRFIYDNGILEIFMPLFGHENPARTLEFLFMETAIESEIDFVVAGSMTLKKSVLKKGVEPDASFYIQSAPEIEGKTEINLDENPPPDLVIEADLTSSSLPRFPIFANLGVKEVWRIENENVFFYELENQNYRIIENSFALPILTSAKATEFLRLSKELKSTAWAKKVRQFVAENRVKK